MAHSWTHLLPVDDTNSSSSAYETPDYVIAPSVTNDTKPDTMAFTAFGFGARKSTPTFSDTANPQIAARNDSDAADFSTLPDKTVNSLLLATDPAGQGVSTTTGSAGS